MVSPAPVLLKLNVVRTQIVRLIDVPLETDPKTLAPNFAAIFCNRSALTADPGAVRFGRQMCFRTDDRRQRPFVRDFGALVLDVDRANLEQRSPRGLAQALGDPDGWEHEYKPQRERYFYFDPGLADERMNVMPFTLSRTTALRAAVLGNQVRSRAYVHVYAFGFGAIQLSQTIVFDKPFPLEKLGVLVSVLGPRNAGDVRWTSRFGETSLSEFVERLYARLAEAIDGGATIPDDRRRAWHTSIRLSDCDGRRLASALLDDGQQFGSLAVSHRKQRVATLADLTDGGGAEPSTSAKRPPTSLANLYFHDEFFIATQSDGARPDRAVRAFWRVMELVEFALVQHAVVTYYKRSIEDRTAQLAAARRTSTLARVFKENVTRWSAYDAHVPAFLRALDGHIRYADESARYRNNVPKFRRKLYSEIGKANGLFDARSELATVVDAWLGEADKFEPAIKNVLLAALHPLKDVLKVDPEQIFGLL